MRIYRIANNFDEWFEGSKVVDRDGEPMPVFHGTNQKFDIFEKDRLGLHTHAPSSEQGFFFTENMEEAKKYAISAGERQIADAKEVEKKEKELLKQMDRAIRNQNHDLYERLNIELEDLSLGSIYAPPSGHVVYSVYLSIKNPKIINAEYIYCAGQIQKAIIEAKKEGHDGVKFVNILDGNHERTNQWVAFEENQIRISESIWDNSWLS